MPNNFLRTGLLALALSSFSQISVSSAGETACPLPPRAPTSSEIDACERCMNNIPANLKSAASSALSALGKFKVDVLKAVGAAACKDARVALVGVLVGEVAVVGAVAACSAKECRPIVAYGASSDLQKFKAWLAANGRN